MSSFGYWCFVSSVLHWPPVSTYLLSSLLCRSRGQVFPAWLRWLSSVIEALTQRQWRVVTVQVRPGCWCHDQTTLWWQIMSKKWDFSVCPSQNHFSLCGLGCGLKFRLDLDLDNYKAKVIQLRKEQSDIRPRLTLLCQYHTWVVRRG